MRKNKTEKIIKYVLYGPCFSDNLKRIMKEKGITKEVLTEKLKYKESAIDSMLCGETIIHNNKAEKLANILGVSLADLYLPYNPDRDIKPRRMY